ncbi:MAG: hypothetical protein WCD70_08240 [Alphaproteobacteria bacterium]
MSQAISKSSQEKAEKQALERDKQEASQGKGRKLSSWEKTLIDNEERRSAEGQYQDQKDKADRDRMATLTAELRRIEDAKVADQHRQDIERQVLLKRQEEQRIIDQRRLLDQQHHDEMQRRDAAHHAAMQEHLHGKS